MYFLRRILFFVPLLLVISMLSFGLLRLAPGGPFDRDRAPASAEIERQLRARYHLDEPVPVQYGRWLGDALRGDLGLSLKYRNHSVADIILQGLPVSLALGLLGFGFAIGVGVPIGFFTAMRRGGWADWGGSFLVLVGICVPGFVVGPLLVMVFALELRWFPAALWGSPMQAVLPMVALGLYFAGRVARLMREGMAQTLRSEFIRTARAKGLGEHARRHGTDVAERVHPHRARQGARRTRDPDAPRVPVGRDAGGLVQRTDAGGSADRFVRGREHLPDPGHRRVHRGFLA